MVQLGCAAVLFVVLLLSACGSTLTQKPNSAGQVDLNAKAVDVPASANGEYQAVLAAVDNKAWARAENLLIQMQSRYPQLSSIKAMLGWVYWQGGKVKEAINYLEAVIQNPLYKPDAHNYLAIMYRVQGKFKKAEALYKQALQVWPEDPVLHKNLGILYDLYLIQLSEALAHYQHALTLDSSDKRLKGWVKDLERRTKK